MFLLFLLLITIGTACIPLLASLAQMLFPKFKVHKSINWLPVLASVLFAGAFFVPDIHISQETSTFQQHFIGGGVYCAILYLYFKNLLGWSSHWMIDLLFLFAWTSAIGVANELLEFTLTKLHIANIGTGDTDWDLLANTLGAFTGYAILIITGVGRKNN